MFDRDGRTQAFDRLNIRLLHLIQKLAGVSGKTFDITPLALGINGIKGQGRFPGTAQSRHNNEFVAGQLKGNVLEIVFFGVLDDDII